MEETFRSDVYQRHLEVLSAEGGIQEHFSEEAFGSIIHQMKNLEVLLTGGGSQEDFGKTVWRRHSSV